ncbi:MAG: helix-turn-helix transcriptional regulator [Coriobacteriales bacterium]|nr:helix-turn-helix transcriptional regulator [Coriobacteriales bacterium]
MVVLVLTRNRQKVEYVLTGAVANEDSIAQARSTILAERFPQLSNRELEVLPLMLQNYGNARMAKTLVVSENTVKTHVRHIYAKMGINTRQQLLELASGIKLAPNKP